MMEHLYFISTVFVEVVLFLFFSSSTDEFIIWRVIVLSFEEGGRCERKELCTMYKLVSIAFSTGKDIYMRGMKYNAYLMSASASSFCKLQADVINVKN